MRTAAMLGLLAAAALAGSETPPKGPPWQRDFHEARRQALKEGKPLFLYFTKTY
ncbi:MAG: hypothetical protein ACYSX0_18765 [Planctomycetota bacterium]|jgi:hypothetical protein